MRGLDRILLIAAAALGPLASAPPPLAAASAAEGALFVYLQPFPQDAARLELRVESLAAVREEDESLPLALAVRDLRGRDLAREIRLATGPLPPGRYTGLAIRIGAARLGREDGPADLLSPAEPVPIPVLFRVERGQGVVVTLRLDYAGSVDADFRLTPAFVGQIASRPPVATLGLVSSPDADTVTLFSKATGSVAGVIPTGRGPRGIALDTARRRAYVALSGDDSVIAIGLLEARIQSSLRLRGGDQPTELALTPDGTLLLTANSGSRTVSLIDPLSLVELDRFTVGDRPEAVLVDPGGARAWVFDTAASGLTVLDLARRTVLGTIPTEAEPFRGQFSRTGGELFVIHRFSPFLTVIDTSSLTVARRIFLGAAGRALKVDPRSDLIYVSPRGADGVDVYDPLSALPVDSIPIEGEVTFLAIDGEASHLHAVLPELGEVRVVRLAGKKTVARVDLGAEPYWVTLFGER